MYQAYFFPFFPIKKKTPDRRLHELEHGRHVARLHRRRRRAYAPTSNTASHDTHEKINPWVSFCSLIWVWGSTWRPSAAELRYDDDDDDRSTNQIVGNSLFSSEIILSVFISCHRKYSQS